MTMKQWFWDSYRYLGDIHSYKEEEEEGPEICSPKDVPGFDEPDEEDKGVPTVSEENQYDEEKEKETDWQETHKDDPRV